MNIKSNDCIKKEKESLIFCRAFVKYFKLFLLHPSCLRSSDLCVPSLFLYISSVQSYHMRQRAEMWVMSGLSQDGLIPIVSVERGDLSGQNTLSLSLNRCLTQRRIIHHCRRLCEESVHLFFFRLRLESGLVTDVFSASPRVTCDRRKSPFTTNPLIRTPEYF